ncbi:MAG: c-type cytochrome [Gammaproteobacteria bacterium]|nr:c-type cytochrome [Gammaproteobacteria bacterium]
MKRVIVSSMVLLLSLTGVVHAAGDAAAGEGKAAACAGCHGVDGNSMVPTFPNLAGQSEQYIAKQIADFKAGSTRTDATMSGMAMMLATEQDALDVGAFYATQTLNSTAPADQSKLELGREVYKGGNLTAGVPACQGCHGPTGKGNPAAGYPQLGGQFVEYTTKQLLAFKSGVRSNDDKAVMRNAVAAMTDAEIEAVAHYIASLK